MRRLLILTFLGAGLVATACPTDRPDDDQCERACAVAARCGVLPSILGGKPGDERIDLVDDCVDRCTNSDTSGSKDSEKVNSLFECLLPYADGGLCAIDSCVDAVTCLRAFLPPSVVGEPEVIFRLIDGEYWTLLFEPQLCDMIPPQALSIQQDEIAPLCDGDQDPCRPGDAEPPFLRPPLCLGDGCVDDETCDPRLCGYDLGAAYDCAFNGIETVQFGWLDDREVLHLDSKIYTCDQASAGQVVPGIGHQVVYPVALFNGKMTTRVLDVIGAPDTAEGRSFCWFSHPVFPGEVGWLVRAGPNVIAVPSPGSARIAASISGDPTVFPRGCGCLLDDVGCEDDDGNSNCDNEIDDDRDGLLDAEDPGCTPP